MTEKTVLKTDEEILDWYDKEVKYPFKLGLKDKGGKYECFDPKTNRERLLTIHHNLVKDYRILKNGYPKLSKCGYPICDENKIRGFVYHYFYEMECKNNPVWIEYPQMMYEFRTLGLKLYRDRWGVFPYIKKENRKPWDHRFDYLKGEVKDIQNTDWYNKTDRSFDCVCFSFHLYSHK